ncbi:Uncharacterized protein HZ326_31450 [Fusarium oxysporum f. sp. albedinis]|nr:Uncharacterized protein HZ326_31450 [Fusarium oxysporum f. sp. albedinis]
MVGKRLTSYFPQPNGNTIEWGVFTVNSRRINLFCYKYKAVLLQDNDDDDYIVRGMSLRFIVILVSAAPFCS